MKLQKMIRLALGAAGCAALLVFAKPVAANAADQVTTMATTVNLNLREGAGMSYKVVDTIPKETSVQVFSMTGSGWYHVEYEGVKGYVWYKYLNFEGKGDGTVHDGHETDMFATTALRVRAGAGTNSKVLGVLKKGEGVPVVSKHDNWYKVQYKNQEGYCSGKYLDFGQTELDDCKINKEEDTTQNTMNDYTVSTSLNVRSGAGMSYEVIGYLKKGDVISVTGMQGKWAKFKFKGKDAYCYSTYLD